MVAHAALGGSSRWLSLSPGQYGIYSKFQVIQLILYNMQRPFLKFINKLKIMLNIQVLNISQYFSYINI